jgi:hypothetical protein
MTKINLLRAILGTSQICLYTDRTCSLAAMWLTGFGIASQPYITHGKGSCWIVTLRPGLFGLSFSPRGGILNFRTLSRGSADYRDLIPRCCCATDFDLPGDATRSCPEWCAKWLAGAVDGLDAHCMRSLYPA